jgi:hypothetical protein
MFVAVKVKATGHLVWVHESHVDEEKHTVVKRLEPRRRPGRSKFRVLKKASGAKPVEGSALPMSAGTGEKEVEP